MKIGIIVSSFPLYKGGIGNAAYELARILAMDNEVVVFAPKHKQEKTELESEQFKIERIKPWLQLGHGALSMQLLWKLKHFDVIYLHYPFFGRAEEGGN